MKKKELHIFDLDHTLICANSSYLFGRYLYQQGYFSRYRLMLGLYYYFRHKVFGMSLIDLHKKSFSLFFYQKSVLCLDRYVSDFLDQNLDRLLFPELFSHLKKLQSLGHTTILMSNSPNFLVKAIAKRLGFTDYRSSQYQVDNCGCLCHIRSVLCGSDKAKQAVSIAHELNIHSSQITAYSDSYLDIPLLVAVGKAVVVNPDPQLKKVSLDLQWEIFTPLI